MPFQKMQFLPGFYSEASRIDAANRYVDGDKCRFFKGFPKKMGGSVKTSILTFLGICRGLRTWVTLSDKKYIGIGTNLKLYVDEGGTFFDITPIRATTNPMGNDPFATTNLSTTVTVTDAANGSLVGDFVTFSGATAVAGVTIVGNYQIQTIVDADHYTITVSPAANATTTGGGAAVVAKYEIHVGSTNSLPLSGWGSAPWGSSTWGTPRITTGFLQFARTWSGNNYGEDLVFSPRDGGIYRWVAASGTSTRAVIVTNAPITNKFVLVSSEDRYIIAMGAHDGSNSDPMLIRWSSQDDATDWTPTTTNTAGDKRLSEGNLIITAVSSRGQIIISTDTTVYAMRPDSEFVFGFQTLGIAGCVSPNGMVEHNGIVYWMGTTNFYMYAGNIEVMPCDVRSYVFDNINPLQLYKVYGWVNTEWNEIWWFYQDNNGTDCNRYVCYDYLQNIWHYGSRNMSAGIDLSVVSTTPLSTGTNGYVYGLETGTDEDGVAMLSTYATGSPQDHNRYSYIKKVIVNFKTLVGNMTIQFQTRYYPQNSVITSPTYNITSSTPYVCPRIRGDEFNMIFESDELGGDFWGANMETEVIGVGSR